LHLLRLVPQAWITPDHLTRFEQIPTEFGPVELKFKLAEDRRTLDVKFAGDWRHKPGRVVLHAPPITGLERIVVNGTGYKPTDEIELPL
jgi:hypothetical protein